MFSCFFFFFFSSRRRHTRCSRDWSSDGALPISLAGHCDQAPIARAYPEIASHLDCLRRERAWLGGSGELQHFGNVRRPEWKGRDRRKVQWSLTNHLVDPPRAVDLPTARHIEGTGGKKRDVL